MRVLVVAAWPPWPITEGDRLVMHHQLTHLAARHEVTVVAAGRWSDPPPPGGIAPWDGLVRFEYFPPPPRNVVTYLSLRARSLARGEPRQVIEVEATALRARVAQLVRNEQPDLVHLFGWGTAQLAREVPPHIGVVHSAIDAWGLGVGNRARGRIRGLLEADQPRWARRHERRHYPRCGRVVVVSELDAHYLVGAVPGVRPVVIPNGVTAGPAPDRRVEPGLIGLHGNFSTRANIDAARHLVEEVLPRVRQTVPAARVALIGRKPPKELLALAGPDVSITGEVADVRAELARLDVYVAPMVSGTGIKNKVLEAMAAGLPVVTTDLAARAIPGARALVVADEPAAMAGAVAQLILDRKANARQGLANRDTVVRALDWELSAQRLADAWVHVAQAAQLERPA